MTISSSAISVGTTSASTIVAMPSSDYSWDVRIANAAGVATLWVGGTAAAQSFPVAAGASLTMTMQSNEVLYGIATGGTADVRVFVATGGAGALRRPA